MGRRLKLADYRDILNDVRFGRSGAGCIAAATHRLQAFASRRGSLGMAALANAYPRPRTGSDRLETTEVPLMRLVRTASWLLSGMTLLVLSSGTGR